MQKINTTAELTFQAMDERAKVLQGQVEELTSEVERLRLRVKELEGQASKNSKNSSQAALIRWLEEDDIAARGLRQEARRPSRAPGQDLEANRQTGHRRQARAARAL